MVVEGKINITWIISSCVAVLIFVLGLTITITIWKSSTDNAIKEISDQILQQNTVITKMSTRMEQQDKTSNDNSVIMAKFQAQQEFMRDQIASLRDQNNSIISGQNQILSTLEQRKK